MIRSLHAENFKCFKQLDLSDLQRVNVVVGKNAAGKTALLEAVRLALGGTPNVLWTMNQVRGFLWGVPQPITREAFESVWSSYFFNFEMSAAILTDCCDDENRHATTRVFFDVKRPVTTVPQQLPQQQPQQPQPVLPSSFIPSLAFERSDFSGVKSTLYASVQAQGSLNFDSGPELGAVTDLFPSAGWGPPSSLATHLFSQLSQQQRERAVVDAVRDEFDRSLESLVVLAPSGAPAGLYVGLRYLKEKLPVGYLSAGISRFIVMLSAVLIRSKGVVLIDEIENGISYRIFEPLWKYIMKFAIDNDTQVFATTHSLECVRALLPAMEGHEHEFALLRAEREDGSSAIKVVPGRFLESAIDQGVEVR
jgi:energy-coupling factor transporter ATP-binding protein EcfA2